MAYIGNPPAKFIIPVTIGTDREFTLNRNDGTPQKAPVDWAATVSMAIDIDKASPTVIPATVTGNQAVIVIPSCHRGFGQRQDNSLADFHDNRRIDHTLLRWDRSNGTTAEHDRPGAVADH
jgi:hypothetical protein